MNTPQMNSSGQLEKMLNAQRPPLIKAGIGYEGETSKSKVEDNKNIIFVKVVKDNEATQQIPTKVEASKNMSCRETNRNKQQHERTENERMKQSAAKGSYTPEYELNKFGRCQRRFFPPMRSITCFSCHKQGHTVSYCKTKQTQSNQQRMQQKRRTPQASKWRGQSFTRYTNHFHGYCYTFWT